MKYHYEFKNIDEFRLFHYKITVPKLKNAKWTPNIGDILMKMTYISIYINDLLIDEHKIDPSLRLIYKNLFADDPENRKLMSLTGTYLPDDRILSGNGRTVFVPIFLGDFEKQFKYLRTIDSKFEYKIICDIEIDTDIDYLKNNVILPININDVDIIMDGCIEITEIFYGQNSIDPFVIFI